MNWRGGLTCSKSGRPEWGQDSERRQSHQSAWAVRGGRPEAALLTLALGGEGIESSQCRWRADGCEISVDCSFIHSFTPSAVLPGAGPVLGSARDSDRPWGSC